MCPHKAIITVVAFLTIGDGAAADDRANEITAFGGYRFGGTFEAQDSDASYEWQDASSWGLVWNHAYEANTEIEVFFSRQTTTAEFSDATMVAPTVDVETTTLQLGGTYFGAGDFVRPYLAATLGGTHIRVEASVADSDTFIAASLGVGIKVRPGSRAGLRLEVRAHGALTSDSTDLFCRTGPDLNACAIQVRGNLFGQVEAFAGVVLRF
ncbi:MAG: porin family protein [Gammaproteobacteria bacterium]|nr:porin family protein [Gammaproteobacteria bacterium]